MSTHTDHIKTLICNKSYEEAITDLLELLPDTKEPALVYEMLGRCFLGKHDFSNAIRSFRYAL